MCRSRQNTLILLTSNVGSDLIMNMCKDPDLMPEPEGIAKPLRQPLLKAVPRRRCSAASPPSRISR